MRYVTEEEKELALMMKDMVLADLPNPLSDEQEQFIDTAIEGHNVLVDACIGSGKTTSIQTLCNILDPSLSILYLTFNKLLKDDARAKITNSNVQVTNYHGYVYPYLKRAKVHSGINESIKTFNKLKPTVKKVDVLIIDEYQDIMTEAAELLEIIKEQNPEMQIIAVGDMAQKILDFTTLDVEPWIHRYLANFKQVHFTQCFRISEELADRLADAWDKPIKGVNPNQTVRIMKYSDAIEHMLTKDPGEILALGANSGDRVKALNELMERDPQKFNKYTCYSSIKMGDNSGIQITPDTGVFVTYDKSKGMERSCCVVFDYNDAYLDIRINQPGVKSEIIKNLFLVAASRGKEEIIFVVRDNNWPDVSERVIKKQFGIGMIAPNTFKELEDTNVIKTTPYSPSQMFDFQYIEDINDAYDLLTVEDFPMISSYELDINPNDALLDISSCIGNYASAAFFKDFDVLDQINLIQSMAPGDKQGQFNVVKRALDWQKSKEFGGEYEKIQANPEYYRVPMKNYKTNFKHDEDDIQWQLLCLTAAASENWAYFRQITKRYIDKTQQQEIIARMSDLLDENDPHEGVVGLTSGANPLTSISFLGRYDVIHDDIIYELKFTSELSHQHHLQLATLMVMTGLEVGRLWNLRTNEVREVRIKDRRAFIDQVVKIISKRKLSKWDGPIPGE